MLIRHANNGDIDVNATYLAEMARIAAIEDHCERAAAGARTFGKCWVEDQAFIERDLKTRGIGSITDVVSITYVAHGVATYAMSNGETKQVFGPS